MFPPKPIQSYPIITLAKTNVDFPSGPVVGTLHFHCSGCVFNPWSAN